MSKLPFMDQQSKFKVSINLIKERYFEGQRVSQIINTNVVNQLLVTIWDDSGYYKIDRKQDEFKMSYIEDLSNIEDNNNCTDLIQVSTENEDNASYQSYFISRTQNAINLIDTTRERAYCLYKVKNYCNKLRKTTIVPRDLIVKGVYNDRIQFQLVFIVE